MTKLPVVYRNDSCCTHSSYSMLVDAYNLNTVYTVIIFSVVFQLHPPLRLSMRGPGLKFESKSLIPVQMLPVKKSPCPVTISSAFLVVSKKSCRLHLMFGYWLF